MPEPTPDPVAAYLDEVREQIALAAPIAESAANAYGPAYAALLRLGLTDSAQLRAALDAALKLATPVERDDRDWDGNPEGPVTHFVRCDELHEAISRALLGEGETGAQD